MSDARLQKEVLAELNWEPSVTAAHIGVAADHGVVTLTGHVETYAAKQAAERAAGRVKGVRAVAEELDVKLPFDVKRDDSQIAAAIIDRLAWNSSIPRDSVKVKVEQGWVTLTGQLDWAYQKDAAAQEVRTLYGVIGVSNQMTIKPRADASNIRNDIEHALQRSWFPEPNTINVAVNGSTVRLTGSVLSFQDKMAAGATAWAAPGATEVANDITIV